MADSDIVGTGLIVWPGPGMLTAEWTLDLAPAGPLPYLALDHVEVWVAAANDRATATKVADSTDFEYVLNNLGYSVTRYFWIRPADKTGINLGDFYPLSATAGISGTTRSLYSIFDIDPSLVARLDWVTQSIDKARKQIEEVVLRVRDQSQISQGAFDEMRRSLTLQRATDVAYFDERIALGIAYTDAGVNAVALDLSLLGLEVHDPVSGLEATAESLGATILTVAGQGVTLTSQGTLLNAISATLGDVNAGAKFFAEVKATRAGYDASVGFGAYGSNGTTKGEAAIIADAKNDGTGGLRLIGDKVSLMDSSGNVYALFDPTGGYFAKARIPELTVEKLEIVARGLTFEDIVFENNVTTVGGSAVSNRAAWTAGTVRYVDDAGSPASAAIAAGSTGTWSSGVIYIYWVKGATSFSTTTSAATAFATNNVVVGTYQGGSKLVLTWGKLIIDANDGLKALSVQTGGVANSAITAIDTVLTAGATTYTGTTETTIQTLVANPVGGQLRIEMGCRAKVTSGANYPIITFRIREGATERAVVAMNIDDIPSTFMSLRYIDTAAGSSARTFTLTVANELATTDMTYDQRYGEGINYKK